MTSHSINLISDSDEDEEMIFLNHQSLGKRSRNAESQDAGQEIICLSDDNDRLRNNNTESSSQDPGIVCLSSDDDDENVQEMVATKLFPIFKKKKSCSSPTITNSLLGDLHREREQRQSSSSSSSSSSSTLISSAAKKTHQTIGGNGIYHVKALTKEDAKGIARIQREMEVIMNKFTAAGGTGHAGKIGLKGQGFAPDGQALKTSIQESGQKATKLQLEALRKYKTKTLTFGQLHVQGSKSGKLELSAATKKFDGYYEKLVAWMRQHRPDFEFTTIQVNCNTISKPHRDGGNCGPSVIVGAGAYENGRTVLWSKIKGQHAKLYAATRDWELSVDAKRLPEPSHRIEIASQSLMFDGDKTWHASEYFGGRRWSFVFFNMKHGMKSTKANATTTTSSSSSSTTNPTTKGQREV